MNDAVYQGYQNGWLNFECQKRTFCDYQVQFIDCLLSMNMKTQFKFCLMLNPKYSQIPNHILIQSQYHLKILPWCCYSDSFGKIINMKLKIVLCV